VVDELKLLKQASLGIDYQISDNIIIHHPTLNEICEFGEQKYYGMVASLVCNPSVYKISLWDMGIDWNDISDFDFFVMMSQSLPKKLTEIILNDLDLSKLIPAHNNETNELILCQEIDGETKIIIDRALYTEMADYIRKIHGFEKKVERPADEHTKKYLIERERKHMARHKNEPHKSVLKALVSSMVNHPGFKYNYATVWDLPISIFNDSVSRIQKFLHYTQTMGGAYAGTIDLKNINTEELNWLN
jgi:hypothetical protein